MAIVFASCARALSPAAEGLLSWLSAQGLTVALGGEGITHETIRANLELSSVILLLLEPSWWDDETCKRTFEIVSKATTPPVIVVLLTELSAGRSLQLSRASCVDLSAANSGYESLQGKLDAVLLANPLARPATPAHPAATLAEMVEQYRARQPPGLSSNSPSQHDANKTQTRILTSRTKIDAPTFDNLSTQIIPTNQKQIVGRLTVINGPGEGQSRSVFGDTNQIGRSSDNAIALDFGDNTISRNGHAVIDRDRQTSVVRIVDGGKPNPIFVNGERLVGARAIANGDIIKIGSTTLRFTGADNSPTVDSAEESASSSRRPRQPKRRRSKTDTVMATEVGASSSRLPPQPKRRSSKTDTVDCSVFAPPECRPGDIARVQVFLHLEEQADDVVRLADDFGPENKRQAFTTLTTGIARGATIGIHFDGDGLVSDESSLTQVWRGRPAYVEFLVSMPSHAGRSSFHPVVRVSIDGRFVGRLRFALRVNWDAAAPQSEPRDGEVARYEKIFFSYASADRQAVLPIARACSIMGQRFFQDILSLEPGQRWERQLYREIETCDLVLVFWSTAAKNSEWVRREVNFALERQNNSHRPDIIPYLLEGPPAPVPHEEWQALHFNDPMYYTMLGLCGTKSGHD